MKTHIILLAFAFLLSFGAQSQRKTTVAGNYSYETECLGVELDGSQTLRVWGTGRNKKDAVEQAKKNAVREVLFKGIRGGGECEVKPLVTEVNAEDKYANYFNKFFRDEGLYKFFVNLKDEKVINRIFRESKVSKNTVTIPVVVRVQRAQLKEQLLQDNILVDNNY